MRVAFFGGTFDPPHCGHLTIASAAADRLHLDKVLFAPVGRQPLKHEDAVASFADRLAMVRLAVETDARFEVSAEDAAREDGQANYTIDVMQRVKNSLKPDDRLYCLIGADSFLSFPKWHRASDLLFLCDFIVAARPGFDLHDLRKGLPTDVRVISESLVEPSLSRLVLARADEKTSFYILPDLQEDVSATRIRAVLAGEDDADDVLPQKVTEYIRGHHLYR